MIIIFATFRSTHDFSSPLLNYTKEKVNTSFLCLLLSYNFKFDMVFFFDNLMSPLEKRIMDTGKNMGIDYELDDVRSISYDIENSDEYDDLITNLIKNHDLGREM